MTEQNPSAMSGEPKGSPFVLSIDGTDAVVVLTCECGASRITIRSTLNIMERTFLKSYLKGGQPPKPGDLSIRCDVCAVLTDG